MTLSRRKTSFYKGKSGGKSLRLRAECVTLALTSLMVAVLIGLVVFVWMTQTDQPPILQITRETGVRQIQGHYYVPFTVTNIGGGTAESVQVIGALQMNGEAVETGEQQVDFLSSGEQESGAFVFSRNPDEGTVILRVASYKLP